MGMMDDGCTSLAWKTDTFSVAGQNWDVCNSQQTSLLLCFANSTLRQWEEAQKARLVLIHIKPNRDSSVRRPKISLVTEAGLLSKSGLNSCGVAVFVNAIKAAGVKFDALPIHIALRTVLDCESRLKAIARLCSLTLGTSGHIMIADKTGGTSLEFSHLDIIQMEMVDGQIAHTNHFLVKHDPAVVDSFIFPDSLTRQKRIMALLGQAPQQEKEGMAPTETFEQMLEDEDGFPTAINRKSSPIRRSETLYSFVTDLKARTARIRLGRPNECEGVWTLKPAEL
jgi:isopenicillin-N N-acyltransferase-like protein